jgi:hypothetical protein
MLWKQRYKKKRLPYGASNFESVRTENYVYIDKFEQLFGDLYIGKHPTPRHNSYMVLNLDFSGLDTSDEESFKVSLSYKLQSDVRRFITRYAYR